MTEQKSLLCTTTGEVFQLVRIYYEIFNKKSVLSTFNKLRCMEDDPLKNRWVWLYEYEAKSLRFKNTYNKIPKEMRPVVIGALTFHDDVHMYLDVRSVERATKSIEFFDKCINRRVAKVTHLRVVNELFEATKEQMQKLIQESVDGFFERDDLPRSMEAELTARLKTLKEECEDTEARRLLAIEWIEEQAQKALPRLEEIPTNFYEDGIGSLETALHLRQLQLLEQWKGNDKANMLSMIRKIVGSFPLN